MKTLIFIIGGFCFLNSCWRGTVKKDVQVGWGGRAVSIDVDPNNSDNVWVATPTGGLFHSGNGGADWGHYDELPENNCFDIKIAPWNSSTLIATCIEDTKVKNGGGIWVSNDAGHTWKQPVTAIPRDMNNNLKNYSAFGISFQKAFHNKGPEAPYNIYVGTDSGFDVSTDRGITWRIINPQVSGIKNSIFSIVALTSGKVVTFGDQGIWMADKNLTLWYRDNNQIPFNGINSTHLLAQSPLSSNHLFLTNGNGTNNLFYSIDAGINWKPISSNLISFGANYGGTRGVYIKAIQSASGKGNDVDLYYGNDGIVVKQTITWNGSDYQFPSTWTNVAVTHSDNADMGFSRDRKTFYAANDGGVEKSTDGGATWQHAGTAANRFDALQVYDTKIVLSGDNYTKNDLYFGTQDNNVYASQDNGDTWPQFGLPEGGNFQGPVTKSEGYIITYFLDQGNLRSGSFLTTPPSKYLTIPFMPPQALSQKPNIYYVREKLFLGFGNYPSGQYALYLSSNDGNVTWTKTPVITLNQNIVSHLKICGPAANPSVIVPFSFGNIGLVRIDNVTDGITSNEVVTPIPLPPQCNLGSYGAQWIPFVISFGVDPNDPNFIILPDIANNNIFITTDGGINWTQRDDLRDAITNYGKYYLHKESILRNNFELSASQVTNITFDPLNTKRILIGTTESGAIYSPDHGVNWYRIKGTEAIPNITSFAFNQVSAGEAVASSWGRGLWTISLDLRNASGTGSIFPSAYAQKSRNYRTVAGDKTYANKLYYDTLSPLLYLQTQQGSDFRSIVGGAQAELIGKRWLKTKYPSSFIFTLDNHIMDWKALLSIESDSFRVKMPLLNIPEGHKLTVIENDEHGHKLESTLYFNILAADNR